MLPVVPPEVCEPRTRFQGVKMESGVTPMGNAGRSAIHSALSFWQLVQDCTVEKLFAGVLASLTASVYEVPERETDALIRSPGRPTSPLSPSLRGTSPTR